MHMHVDIPGGPIRAWPIRAQGGPQGPGPDIFHLCPDIFLIFCKIIDPCRMQGVGSLNIKD